MRLPSYAQVNLSPIKDRAKRIGLEMPQMEMSPSFVFTEDLEYKKKQDPRAHRDRVKSLFKMYAGRPCLLVINLTQVRNKMPEACFCLKVIDHLLWEDGTSQNK